MDTHNEINFKKFICSSIAGGTAGISVDFVLFPIDSIKTRLQASTKDKDYTSEAKKVNKFRGFISSMLASFPCAATFWTTYEVSKLLLINSCKILTPLNNKWSKDKLTLPMQHFLAASVAESTQALIRNPFEVIKQNQQIGKYHTIFEAVSDIFKKSGIRGFYKGYLSLVSREIPFSGLQFPLYEWLKRIQIRRLSRKYNIKENDVKLDFIHNAINGSLAGSTAGFIVTPIDVLKTRQMTHDINRKSVKSRELFISIYKENGLPGLFRGASMRVLYLSFGGSAFFGIYEVIKKQMEQIVYD